jgi:pimeloyl-ACP methyl ester carboxylesterase
VSQAEATKELGLARTTRAADGATLPYFVTGAAGPLVVCVNALGQDLLVFSRVVQKLAQRHRVILWKPRGTFELDREVTTLWDQVADLERICEAEAVEQCALLSWCSGAKVAIEFAQRASSVCSLVLTNGTFKTYPGLEHAETEFEQMLFELCSAVVQSPELAPMVMDSMRGLLAGGAGRFSASGGSAAQSDSALSALIVEPFQSSATTLRYAKQVVNYLSHDISQAASSLRQPVLLLAGRDDRVSSNVMARAVADRIPRGDFAEIGGGTHYCLYEKSAEALSLIESFLARSVGLAVA